MPLRRKLLLSMVIPALLLGMLSAIGIVSLRHLERAAGRILADNYRTIQESRRMTRSLMLLESPPRSPASATTRAARERATRDFDDALSKCERNITERGEVDVLRDIRTAWQGLRATLGDPQTPHALPTQETLHGSIEALITLNERAMIRHERDTRTVAQGMLSAVVVSTVLALAALALFAVLSANRLSKPLTVVAERLHEAINPESRTRTTSSPAPIDEVDRLRTEVDALLQRLTRYEDEQARKLSHLEGRLAFVINEVLEGLVLMDADHRILVANRVGRSLLGLGTSDGRRLEDLALREDLRTLLVPLMDGSFRPDSDLGEVTFDMDGRTRIFRPRVLTVPAVENGVEGYLVLFWDVTEQRRLEESRRRFISMLSHQLKTPMTSLAMSIGLIRERLPELGAGDAELLSIATENCNVLAGLVSDLIEAARGSSPDLALKRQWSDITPLLRNALRPLVPQAEEKGVTLVVPPDTEAVRAYVDPVKFPWVVTNIVGNALRYTEPGGRVEVSVAVSSDEVSVVVRDTGSGIAHEDMQRIFQPYVSLDEQPEPGTHGLGLAIAREVIEAHGGVIEATSERGLGTRFLVRLPQTERHKS